jgi:2-methylcitrate dehydratase PrpD
MADQNADDGSVIGRLSRYMVEARSAPLPAEVMRKAKHHILDTMAAMVSGAHLPPGRLAIDYAQSRGGTPEAQVVGSSLVTEAGRAAMANGFMAHADETDDSHAATGTHPGCAVVPAALAMAERGDRSGQRFLNAVVLGYDVGCRVIRALGYRERLEQRGFSSHSVGELFGAAAAAGAGTDIDAARMRYLLSYTAQQASGIPSWVADQDHIEKAFDFAGMPARNGVEAATLVDAGFTGVWDVFGGDRNFFRSFGTDPQPEEILGELGSRYEVMTANIKKYCVGSPIQAAADALANIMERHELGAAQVERMVVTLPAGGARIVNDRHMPDINLQYILSVILLDGHLSFAAAHDVGRMQDPAVLDLRGRIELQGDDALVTPESPRQAVVEIATRDGERLREHVVMVRGTAENPMTAEEVEQKARDLLVPSLGEARAEGLIAAVAGLESLGSVRDLRPLLKG